jgi:lysophospholipase L1-like esterase
VVLNFPSNDAMAGVSAAETVDNLLLLRRIELDRGAVVLVTSSQPRDDADASQRATMQAVDAALVAELGDCFVEVRSSLVGADGGLADDVAAGDGVHLNAQGHRKLFERVLAAIIGSSCFASQR